MEMAWHQRNETVEKGVKMQKEQGRAEEENQKERKKKTTEEVEEGLLVPFRLSFPFERMHTHDDDQYERIAASQARPG